MMRHKSDKDRGLGPFSGGQLTIIIVVLAGILGLPAIASAGSALTAGAPDVWSGTKTVSLIGGNYQNVVSITVPSGNYVVSWSVQTKESKPYGAYVSCRTVIPGGTLPVRFGSITGPPKESIKAGIALSYSGVVKSLAGTISVQCVGYDPQPVNITAEGSLSAVQAKTVH